MPLYGAPMPMATYADVIAPARSDPNVPVHARMAARVQRNTGLPPMPPVANGMLTDQEIAMIQLWSENGAPEGTPPAEMWGRRMKPSSSSATISLRTVAGLTRSPLKRATALEATGTAVLT